MHVLEERPESWLVKTENYDAPSVDVVNLPNVKVSFGQRNNQAVIKSLEYNKEKYSETDVQRIIGEKLFNCVRCNINSKSRVGEKRMAYVNYMQVGKEVLVAGLGGAGIGLAHIMFLQPQLGAAQIIPGVSTLAVADIIIAFVVGVITAMYAKTSMQKLIGMGAAGTLAAVGILSIAGQALPIGTQRVAISRAVPVSPMGRLGVARASYLAAPGVVVNKHGTVPEIAPGTFG